MPEQFSSFAEVKFLDHHQILCDLRQAVSEAKAAHPEIVKVLLFGSLVQGNWTADSDADLIVVVRREFPDFLRQPRPLPDLHPFYSHGLAGVFGTRV